MKTSFVVCFITMVGFVTAQAAQQEGNAEAAKIAREASTAAKEQDWNKAIDGFRKAAEKDRKYTQALAATYSARAVGEANDQRFQEALADLAEAIKIEPKEARFYEQRAALVRQLLDQGESAIGILLVAILPTVRNLLLAKDLMERHRIPRPHVPFPFISAVNRLPADAIAHLPRKKDGTVNAFALGIAAQNAHRFSTQQLIAGMRACLEANLQLVSTQLDHELILTEVVVKLLGQ